MVRIEYGPYHPAFKEPIGITLEIEGEKVVEAKVNVGYVHRGVEQVLENSNWISGMVIASKICGICSSVHCTTFSMGVEKIFGIDPPERAKYIRMIVLELERIASHLLWLGTFMHEIGYETLFMLAWGDREKILEFMERFSGRRVGWMVSIPGGVRRDLNEKLKTELRELLNYLEKRADFYEREIKNDTTILMRTKNVGIVPRKMAEEYGVVGPMARGSGVKRDIRFQDPYLFYKECPFNIVLEKNGDCFSRMMVRIKEMKESIKIIRWCLEEMTGGEIVKRISPFQRPDEKEAISRAEAPRGELFYYLKSSGKETPERVKIRTPTFANVSVLEEILKDCYLADVPAIVFSLDPCIACMERLLIIKDGKKKILTREELREYSKKWYKRNFEKIKRERL